MAHDSRREDYQRLALRFARTIDPNDPSAARAFAGFGRRFAQEYDSLPQSDADRAFHLVSLANEVIDHRLPFSTEDQAPELIRRGHALLDEAESLDPACFDAVRMKLSSQIASLDARYQALVDREPEVFAACEKARDVEDPADDDERRRLSRSLAMRPYWRWLATMAEAALVCGRNRECVRVCEKLLASDKNDLSDVRFTLAYALAKLEDQQGLDALLARYPRICPGRGADDAWVILAQLTLAHRCCDLEAARECLKRLSMVYPGAPDILLRQVELPDGEFARLNVAPYSEDELVVALSEGTVLLQEGNDRTGRGVLGSWIIREATRMWPKAAARVAKEIAAEGGQAR